MFCAWIFKDDGDVEPLLSHFSGGSETFLPIDAYYTQDRN